MDQTRLRIYFTKTGDLRWISHRDLARVWERLLRRAGLQLAFSQGFHPKPKISFPSALALGIEALEEIVELEIVGSFSLEQIRSSIVDELPPGMELLDILVLESAIGKVRMIGASYRVAIDEPVIEALEQRIVELKSLGRIEVDRDGKMMSCNMEDPNFELKVEDGYLAFTLPADSSGSLRPVELLQAIGLPDLLSDGALLQRDKLILVEPQLRG